MMFEQSHAQHSAPSAYGERHVSRLPDRAAARTLLAQITEGVCTAAPQPPHKPMILYGAGDLGRMARDYFSRLGFAVDLVIDRNAAALRDDPFWQGVTLAHPDTVSAATKQNAQLLLCIATAPYKALETLLAADGWQTIIPFYDVAESQRDRHPLSNGWFAPPLDDVDIGQVTAVLDQWDDDISRAHHLQFLAWRRLRAEWTFEDAPVTGGDRFFIPEVLRAQRPDVVIDAGAHHGNVTKHILTLWPDVRSIIAIEPDEANSARLSAMRGALPSAIADRITLLPTVLDAAARDRPFHDGLGYASQWSATGAQSRQGTTLDSLDLAPDFIKLHLEGAERDALCGALATIQRHRPVLAVTTYHNADGIWRTPAWLMEHCEKYRFLMRLHSWCGTGAVVYAIPRERG